MDDPDKEQTGSQRRRFLWLSGIGALGAASAGGAVVLLDFVHPKVLFEPPAEFRVGKPEDFPVNSVTADHERRIYIVRTEVGFFALSAVCTHLGCITRWVEDESAIACPCHGSKFDKDGSLALGPAPRSLRRIAIRLEDGQLVVDTAVEVIFFPGINWRFGPSRWAPTWRRLRRESARDSSFCCWAET